MNNSNNGRVLFVLLTLFNMHKQADVILDPNKCLSIQRFERNSFLAWDTLVSSMKIHARVIDILKSQHLLVTWHGNLADWMSTALKVYISHNQHNMIHFQRLFTCNQGHCPQNSFSVCQPQPHATNEWFKIIQQIYLFIYIFHSFKTSNWDVCLQITSTPGELYIKWIVGIWVIRPPDQICQREVIP